ncbi:MAG: hypothetical protein Q8T03_12945 [Bacteroidota bacterium]|nr:hypothetical protein [Bacteroidota bacterium]
MDFGKNRIQYQNFNWTYFDYERYRIYSYQGGGEISKFVSVSVNKQLPILEKKLDYQSEEKINILVYNNQNDFKQSNLGLSSDEQTNIGGVTKIIGNKMSVFFNGSHAELEIQIKAGIAQILINQILYGGSAREMVRNSTLLNLPPWYTNGLVSYISEGTNSYTDNYTYDAIKNDHLTHFNRLEGKEAVLAGHSLWAYIVESYGEAVIPNLLYMTRVTRSPDNAFLFVLGVSLSNLVYDFTDSYNRRLFMNKDSLRKSPINNNSVLKKYKTYRQYYQLKISPDGKQVIYTRNELNQVRVYLNTIGEKKQKRLLKFGPKLEQLPDYSYPLLGWHPNGKTVFMIYEKKDQLIIHTIDLENNEKVIRNLPGFEKINSFSFSPDGKKLVISAVKKGKGQSDIFVFSLNTSAIEQLTNDIWDDNYPVFIKGNKHVVFESNRLGDTIKASDDAKFFYKINKNMDLFMAQYPFTNKTLVRVTNTPEINETQPQSYKNNYVVYLSEKNGIYNRYIAEFDSSISFVDTTEHYRYFFKSKPITNFDRNILEQNINEQNTHVAEVIYANGKNMMLVSPIDKLNEVVIKEPQQTWAKISARPVLVDISEHQELKPAESIIPKKDESSNKGIDFDNYKFEGEKNNATKTSSVTNGAISLKKDTTKKSNANLFNFPIQKNYFTSFYTDYVVTQFDNSFLANNYQLFAGGGSPLYLNPGFNFLTKVAISDLFEDQRIIGGFRFNPSLDNEFMLSWERRKKLIDYTLLVDRQTFARVQISPDLISNFFAKVNTHSVSYKVKYPFSPVASIRGSLLYRNDRYVPLSNGDFSLPLKPVFQNMAGARLEYVFDNTRSVMLNIMNGLRFKVWSEYWQIKDSKNKNLFTSGFDLRHYQKVHRQITWCNRFAGGNSLGTDRLIFYLGGVDNWLNPSFNSNINIVRPEQYGFQTIATNMRGFKQNIRNGNNFLVYNSELRFPIVRYLINYPLRSDFLNNFQIIGFTDLGMAWTDWNPLSKENTENTNVYPYEGSNIIVTVNNPKNPLVGGMGFGFRSRLLGYFVRLDIGYGIDNWQVQKRIVGFSLATDF